MLANAIKSLDDFLFSFVISKNMFKPMQRKAVTKYFLYLHISRVTINVMKCNVFHYLLYSTHMNTLIKEC